MSARTYLEATRSDAGYWRDTVGGDRVTVDRIDELAGGNSPSRVYRVSLRRAAEPDLRLIVKESAGPWPEGDPTGYGREPFVYERILPGAPGIAPELVRVDQGPDHARLVLEDLSVRFRFADQAHLWSTADLRPATDALARLHTATVSAPALGDTRLMSAPHRRWDADRIRAAAEHLARTDAGPWLIGAVDQLLEEPPLDAEPDVLLHADFNTGALAIPLSAQDGARLVDWHLAAAGAALYDVACLFYQPYNNHLRLTWTDALDAYAAARNRLDSPLSSSSEEPFRRAVAWCGLSYLPALARQSRVAGGLSGWWANTVAAVETQFRRCLRS